MVKLGWWIAGAIIDRPVLQQGEPRCVWKGNSFSLSGVCDDRGQLPREGAVY